MGVILKRRCEREKEWESLWEENERESLSLLIILGQQGRGQNQQFGGDGGYGGMLE